MNAVAYLCLGLPSGCVIINAKKMQFRVVRCGKLTAGMFGLPYIGGEGHNHRK